MAEKKSGISYEQIIKDLKARKFAPVYVLMGDESFYIDKICDFISENVLKPEEQDFNQTVVFGADVNAMQDMIVKLCMENGVYDVLRVNELLFMHDVPTLN